MGPIELEKVFACPECGFNLRIFESKLSCPCCKREWVIDDDGVIRFLNNNYFFGASQEECNRLLAKIRTMSAGQFFSSLYELEGISEDFDYSYCLDPARADWTLLGDFSQKIIVDLGCGYGSISIPLAKRAKLVFSVDATLERVKFLSIIANLEGVKNVVPIHADVFKLPFKKGTIDSFVMIGLLEWVGTLREDKSPMQLQQDLLVCLKKLLSENGELWIGIENRLNPLYFTGKTHHGDLPFAPLMPRFMANSIHHLLKNCGYRTWTYTKHGYQKLLKRAGFKNIELFYAFPHYQLPKFILSTNKQGILARHLRETSIVSQSKLEYVLGLKIFSFLDYLNIAGTFAPSFFITARRS